MKKYEKKFKIYLLILLLFIAVISISAALFIKSDYFAFKVKNYLSAYASAILKKQITIKKIKFSIFSPQIKFYGLSIKNVAKIKRINISLGPLNLFKRKIIIYKINVINPNINILIKNNRIDNYKNLNLVIKALLGKQPFSFVSVSFDKLQITQGNLNLQATDNNILLKLKKFDFTAYKKPNPIPFLYNNNGIYFKYKMPYVFLKSDKLKFKQIFNSNAVGIHYFNGFVKYRKISFANSYFTVVSGGILELKKKIKISGIIKKINDTTLININSLSYFSKNFASALPPLQGKSNVKLTVTGDLSGKINAEALIHLENVVFSGGDIKNGVIECGGNFGRVKNSIINFKYINLNVFEGSLKSTGSINLKEKEGKFKSTLKNINVGKLIEFYDAEKIPQFKALANGNVTTFLHLGKNFYAANIEKIELNKPVQQLKFKSGKGIVSIYSINYRNRILIKGETLINNKFVLLKNIHVSSRILRGSAEGKINYAGNYLSIGFNSDYKELPAVNLIEEYKSRYFDPSGSGILDGNVKGEFNNISFSFRNRFKTLYVNGYSGAYKGTADVDIAGDGKVLFKKVSLKEKNLKFNKRGTLAFSGEIFENKISKKEYINGNFNAKNIHLISKKPPVPLSISFNSNGIISGELENPVFEIAADSKKAEVYGQHISDVNFTFLLTKAELKVKRLEGIYNGAIFNGYGSLRFAPPNLASSANSYSNYNLRLILNRVNLANLDLKLLKKYHIRGTANVNLHIGGSFNLPDISGNASISDIYINDYLLGDVSAAAYSSGSNITLNLSALKNTLKAKATVLLKKGYPYNFIANINLLSIEYRKTIFRLSGGVFGSGKLSDIKSSYIFSKLDYMYLKHGPFFLKNTKNIKISYMNGAVSLSGFELKGGNNYFQIKGNITPKKYDVILNDRTDLWVLGIFSDKIMNSSGFITASAVIFGPSAAPRLYGFANIDKGLIEPSVYSSFAASRIFAKLIFNNNMIFIQKARFRMLNGIFSAHGIIRMNNFKPSYYNVAAGFNSAIYRKSNYFYAKMNGKIGLSGNADNPILYGNVDIKRALYDRKINLSSFILKYKHYNIVHAGIKKRAFNPRLNIRITSNKGIAIKNNIINTDFSAGLNLIGTAYDPILMGTAGAENGEIYFRGTMFKLIYANLDFNNQYMINPSFDVAARTHINEYIIRMNASGALLNFNVNLSSTPPLSELDIVSMLALGAPTTSVYAGSAGGIAAAEAASAIGGGVEQGVTGAISSYFGFKNLSVAPSYSVITHSAAPQVSVTKTLTKKLSISYSNIISSQSSQSVTITYGLSRHISLIGVWENNELAPNNSNVYSEVGGNIVFHFRFY
ncbi:MAG: translocation/assembly module TamB domain-containing protein [bacterium]